MFGDMESILSTNFLLNLRTGNMVTDTILAMLVSWVLKQVLGGSLPKLAWPRWCRKRVKSTYTIEGSIFSNMSNSYDSRFEIPDEFMTLMYIMKQKGVDIRFGKKFGAVDASYIDTDEDGNSEDNIFTYFIDHSEEINIDDEVYVTHNETQENSEDKKISKTEISLEIYSYTLTFEKLKARIDKWIKDYHEFIRTHNDGQLYYFSYIESNGDNNRNSIHFENHKLYTSKRFDNIFFEDKSKLLKRLHRFNNCHSEYERLGIPRTLGLMFYGPPGCGKTSTIKALANSTKRHVVEIHLSRVKTCTELKKIFFQEVINSVYVPSDKRIIVLEDIDCMSNIIEDRSKKEEKKVKEEKIIDELLEGDEKKEAKAKTKIEMLLERKDEITLSFILNLIDGVLEQPGRILIVTTNHPEKIDRALVRPGRIDLKINFKLCNKEITNQILSFYFQKEVNANVPEYRWSPADIFEKCMSLEDEADVDAVVTELNKEKVEEEFVDLSMPKPPKSESDFDKEDGDISDED